MSLASLIFSVVTLRLFGLTTFMVEGPSMEPTLHDGELFMVNQTFENTLERGDIVVFSFKEDPDYFYVKRIIGLPGDRVQIREDGLYIVEPGNEAKRLIEPYLEAHADTVPLTGAYRQHFKQTYVVPADKYFVLGDNREHSLDSRYFRSPFVAKSRINGEYLFHLPLL